MKRFLVVVLTAFTLASCGQREQAAKSDPESPKAAGAEGHPEKYIEEANVVELSLEAQRRAGIEVAPLAVGSVEVRVVLTGTVQPIDNHVSQVRPLARGRITQVLVKVGDRVQKDQTLALFDNIEAGELTAQYGSGQAELEKLKIQQSNAQRQAERSRSLVAIGAVPAKDAENAEADARALAQAVRAEEATLAGIAARLTRFGVQSDGKADAAATTIRRIVEGSLELYLLQRLGCRRNIVRKASFVRRNIGCINSVEEKAS